MKKIVCIIVFIGSFIYGVNAQVRTPAQQLILTNEDSLNAGISKAKTVLSGYGSTFYQRNSNQQTASLKLERAILFIGHQFNSKISVFTKFGAKNRNCFWENMSNSPIFPSGLRMALIIMFVSTTILFI